MNRLYLKCESALDYFRKPLYMGIQGERFVRSAFDERRGICTYERCEPIKLNLTDDELKGINEFVIMRNRHVSD